MKTYYFVVEEHDLEAHNIPPNWEEGVSYTKLRIFARDLGTAYSKAKNHLQLLQQEYRSYSLLTLSQFNQIKKARKLRNAQLKTMKGINRVFRRKERTFNFWYLILAGILALIVWLFWLSQVAI